MEIYLSIDGVLRNTIQKFVHHYTTAYLETEPEEGDTFEYKINEPIQNDNLISGFTFQSKEQFDYFFYIEYALEIFGHGGLSQTNSISTLNNIIVTNSGHTFTVVGLDELGKARPATLFFLSKNGCMVNNVKFLKSDDIQSSWEKCDVWITDNKSIIDACPEGKVAVKFNTPYNQHFTNHTEISKLSEIEETWFTSLEKPTT